MKKWISLLLSCLIICTSLTGCALNEKDAPEETLHEHSYGAWEVLREADCDLREILVHTCTECGESQNWFGQNATGMHAYDKNNVCTHCGSHFEHDDLEFTAVSQGYSVSLKASATCKEIGIPTSYQGDPVTTIAKAGFSNNTTLEKVYIPNQVRYIGEWAFGNCTALKSVTIPSSVVSVGEYAFANCTSLTQVIIQDGVEEIYNYAFTGCRALSDLRFGKNVRRIGTAAFAECDALVDVVLSVGIEETGMYAFGWCDSLKAIYYPKSIKMIREGAVYKCAEFSTIYYEGDRVAWHKIAGNSQFSFLDGALKLVLGHDMGSDG